MATSHPASSRKAAEPTSVESDHDVLLHELAALRRSEAVLRDFIETSTIGLHWVGADGTILWANQAELDLLGYPREEYVGRNIAEFHADEPVINDMLTRLNRGETLRDHPARMRHRDGSIRHVLVNSSALFEDGKFVHTRCYTRDVTALRQEQETNRLLAAIVDSSDDAIISEDLTGRITSWNRGAERIFGYTGQEVIGQSSIMLIPEDHLKEEVQIRTRLQRGEPVDHFETLGRRKDGKLLNISLTISPVRDQHGRLVGGSKIARDITEGKRAEEAIKSFSRQQAADLAALTRMQELSTRLIQPGAFSDLLNEILEAGIAITKADMGDIELLDADGEMRIAAQRGFKPPFLEFLSGPLAYRSVLQQGERVIIEDIASSPLIVGTPTLTVLPDAGARAMQSTPLVSRSGQVLGIFSTYYRQPRGPTERDLRLIDVLVRLAADLIERSRAEEQLRESEQRLRFAQDTANIGTFDWNIATGQNTWTTKLEIMYGLTPGGFLGTQPAWEALIHPEDRPRVLQRVTESLEAGAPTEDEWRVIWPDGSVHWLAGRWRVLKDAGGKPVRMMGVNIDVTDRKHMEEALRESEERLRLAIKATNDAIWDIDLKTGTVSWNDTYSALYGRPPETSDSLQWWIDRIHPEDREGTVADLRAAIASGAFSWSFEYRFRRVDGEWAHIYDRSYIARDASGKAWRVIGAMQDLTDRKKAEAALAESEERFRNMADTAPVMIWMTGPDKGGTFFNKDCLEFTGRTLDMERGDGWIAGLHPEDREQFLGVFSSAIDARRQFRSLVRIRRADAEYRWVLLTGIPRFGPDDVFEGYIGSGIDITDQKLVEERLRASEARLMSAQHLAKLGSWERDEETGNTEFSGEMLRILGMPEYPPPTLAEFLNYVHPEDRERVWEGALRARSTGAPVAGEYRIVRADSEVRFVRSVLQAIRNERGAVIRVVGATQDITDFKRAQDESFAHQKLESVGTLAGGIAHDFNNLLGGVLAQAELALTELDAGSFCREELKAIREVAIRGSEIVRQLMIYAGKESEVVGRVDLSKVVEQMLSLLKVSVSKHAVVIADLAPDLSPIPASAALIRQIVMNLITNASDAIGDRDGVIRVITRRATLRESATLSESLSEGDYLVLEVSDNGCGMSQETQDRVFDPFFTTKSAGRGLGLAVVSGIVRSLGGRIRIKSKPGKGSRFQVLLPSTESTVAPTASSISLIEEPAGPFQEAVVLIVEDEDPLREAVVKMLRKNGFKVLEAADGSAAINLLRANKDRIDVILLDLTIPGASSCEVVAEAAQTRPDVKVVLTSAYGEEMLAPLMSASQIRGFIRKPFQFVDLTQILRNALLT